jgi:uncharacterized membrane protein
MDIAEFLLMVVPAIAFAGTHLGISSSPLRPWLIGRLGRGVYLALYSALSIAVLAWLLLAYRDAPFQPLWQQDAVLRWLTFGLTPVALILLAGGLTPANPMLPNYRPDGAGRPSRGMPAITRHPMMWGIALLSFLHLLVLGDLSSVILFGTMSLVALLGATLQDARKRREEPALWSRLAAETSFLPFLAAVEGRSRPTAGALIGPATAGLVLWGLCLAAHVWLFGASPWP